MWCCLTSRLTTQPLDLLWNAVHPEPEAERSSVGEVLDLYAEMGGSDPTAVAEEDDSTVIMRDPGYHPNDVISALITEVRRLRLIDGPGADD